jgi:predicted porin
MKKTLVALAALAATSAFAQNAVSLYGTLDMGVGNIVSQTTTNTAASNYTVTRSGASTSGNDSARWGMTGTEDLGGGVKAEFKIEQGIGTNPRSGITSTSVGGNAAASAKDNTLTNGTAGNAFTLDTTVLGDRELWVGVTSGALRVNAGYGVTAMRNLAVQTDAAQSNQVGNVIAHEVGGFRREGVRVDYTLAGGWLVSGGVSGNRQNSTGTTASATVPGVPAGEIRSGKGWTLGAQYTQGPINAGYFYDEVTSQSAAVSAAVNTGNVGLPFALGTDVAFGNKTYKTDLLAGSYNAGVATLYGQYYSQNAVINDSAAGTVAADNYKGNGKIQGTSFGVRVPVGATTFFAQTLNLKDKRMIATGTAEDRKFTGSSFGVRYDVSKRTYAYLNTGKIKKDDSVGQSSSITAGEYSLKQTAAGLVHSF